jgi:hypothetical protein
VIEVRALLEGVARGKPLYPDFREAWRIACVFNAIQRSAAERRWLGTGA